MPEPDDTRLSLGSQTPLEPRLEQLRELFPEAFTEGKLDLTRLGQLLGESVATGPERYGLSWAGKAEAVRSVQIPSVGTLVPARDESVDFDTTENLFIEGDNLEVLKLLQKSYFGKIKMIYIDPPYNTGNDFIYPDNYAEPLDNYLAITGQSGEDGLLTTNPETSGRYHSVWLNMMQPRLFLARQLLSEDGLVFISIDDHELCNLRLLMNDVYGDENFVAIFIWHRRQRADSRNQDHVSSDHEYVICYRKTAAVFRGQDIDFSKYSNPDNDPRGEWFSADLTGLATKEQRPNLHYEVTDPSTGVVYPPSPTRGWSISRGKFNKYISDGRILWPNKPGGRPRFKKFLSEATNLQTGFSSMLKVGFTAEGTRAIQDIFGEKIMQFPKPVSLIQELIKQTTLNNDIVLDFFAGSCTTAEAVIAQNKADGGRRKYIMVQLPEPMMREDFSTIAEMGKERIRRTIKKSLSEENGRLPIGNGTGTDDFGFRVFKLFHSNFKIWDSDQAPHDAEGLAQQLRLFADHLLPGSKDEAILYELILKSGLPLTAKVATKTIAGQTVYAVEGEAGQLAVCLEDPISQDTLRGMLELKPAQVLCLDHAFRQNDQLKTNTVLEMKYHGIQFRTV